MPTKTSFRLVPRRSLDRQTSWACLLSNLFVPGSGTLLAGRAIGYAQLGLTFFSLLFTTVFGIQFIAWFFMNQERLRSAVDPAATLADTWMAVRWAVAGIGLFGVAWLWALASSVMILHQARTTAAAPPALARPDGSHGTAN
jgi:hypothetical protein